eukprot:14383180-Heterocapsa_arctica.AAC.1
MVLVGAGGEGSETRGPPREGVHTEVERLEVVGETCIVGRVEVKAQAVWFGALAVGARVVLEADMPNNIATMESGGGGEWTAEELPKRTPAQVEAASDRVAKSVSTTERSEAASVAVVVPNSASRCGC